LDGYGERSEHSATRSFVPRAGWETAYHQAGHFAAWRIGAIGARRGEYLARVSRMSVRRPGASNVGITKVKPEARNEFDIGCARQGQPHGY